MDMYNPELCYVHFEILYLLNKIGPIIGRMVMVLFNKHYVMIFVEEIWMYNDFPILKSTVHATKFQNFANFNNSNNESSEGRKSDSVTV